MNTPEAVDALIARWRRLVDVPELFVSRHRREILRMMRPLVERDALLRMPAALDALREEGRRLHREGFSGEHALRLLSAWFDSARKNMRDLPATAIGAGIYALQHKWQTGRLSGTVILFLRDMRADDIARMLASAVEHSASYSVDSLGDMLREFLINFAAHDVPDPDTEDQLFAFEREPAVYMILIEPEVRALARLQVGPETFDAAVANPMPGSDLIGDAARAAADQLGAKYIGRPSQTRELDGAGWEQNIEDERSRRRLRHIREVWLTRQRERVRADLSGRASDFKPSQIVQVIASGRLGRVQPFDPGTGRVMVAIYSGPGLSGTVSRLEALPGELRPFEGELQSGAPASDLPFHKIPDSTYSWFETEVYELGKDPDGHGLEGEEREQLLILFNNIDWKRKRLTLPSNPDERDKLWRELVEQNNAADAYAESGKDAKFHANARRGLGTLADWVLKAESAGSKPQRARSKEPSAPISTLEQLAARLPEAEAMGVLPWQKEVVRGAKSDAWNNLRAAWREALAHRSEQNTAVDYILADEATRERDFPKKAMDMGWHKAVWPVNVAAQAAGWSVDPLALATAEHELSRRDPGTPVAPDPFLVDRLTRLRAASDKVRRAATRPKKRAATAINEVRDMDVGYPLEDILRSYEQQMEEHAKKKHANVQHEMSRALELAAWVRRIAEIHNRPDYAAFAEKIEQRAAAPKSLRFEDEATREILAPALHDYVSGLLEPDPKRKLEFFARALRGCPVAESSWRDTWICRRARLAHDDVKAEVRDESSGVLPPRLVFGDPSYLLLPGVAAGGGAKYYLVTVSDPYGHEAVDAELYQDNTGERWMYFSRSLGNSQGRYLTPQDAAWGFLADSRRVDVPRIQAALAPQVRHPLADELLARVDSIDPASLSEENRKIRATMIEALRSGSLARDERRLRDAEKIDVEYLERKAREAQVSL